MVVKVNAQPSPVHAHPLNFKYVDQYVLVASTLPNAKPDDIRAALVKHQGNVDEAVCLLLAKQ